MKKTIGKRAFSWLLCVCMIVAMIPVLAIPVFAAVYEDDSKGTEVTDGIVLDDTTDVEYYDEDGNVVLAWDSGALELTLNGIDFTVDDETALSVPDGTKIVLIGENKIEAAPTATPAPNKVIGIEADGDLTITGDGSLTVNSDDATEDSYGINVAGDLIVSADSVEANSGDADNTYGVYADNITISGSLTATAGDASSDSYGIYAKSDIIVSDGSKLIGTGGIATNSYGVYTSTGKISVTGATLTGIGVAGTNSYGVYSYGNISVSAEGTLNGTAGNATAISAGVYTPAGTISVTGATLTGSGVAGTNSYGVYSYGNISVSAEGTLNGTAGDASATSAGVYTLDAINVSDSKSAVSGTSTSSGATNSYGVYAKSGSITEDGTLTGTGAAAKNSYGIYTSDTLYTKNGTITGKSGTATTDSTGIYATDLTVYSGSSVSGTAGTASSYSYGIYVADDAKISGGTVNGYATASSNKGYGIFVYDTLSMTGGKLTGNGQNYGLYAETYDLSSTLTIQGGTKSSDLEEITTSSIKYYTYIVIEGEDEDDDTVYYTVKFDSNGGSSVGSQKIAEGKKAGEPNDPTKYSYSFAGWYTDYQLTNKYDFSKKVTSSFTLYAKWQFSGEGDSSSMFSDIDGHWAKTYIEYLAEKGYVQGIGGGLFAPNANMTRAQFVQIVYNAYGYGAVAPAVSFEDVDQSAWYAAAVNWAFEKGIVTGYDDTSFGSNDPVTREQMATMIVRLCNNFGLSLTPSKDKVTFADDESIADYAKDAVYALQMCGIIEGKGNNMFAPQDTTTRGEMAKILYFVVR